MFNIIQELRFGTQGLKIKFTTKMSYDLETKNILCTQVIIVDFQCKGLVPSTNNITVIIVINKIIFKFEFRFYYHVVTNCCTIIMGMDKVYGTTIGLIQYFGVIGTIELHGFIQKFDSWCDMQQMGNPQLSTPFMVWKKLL